MFPCKTFDLEIDDSFDIVEKEAGRGIGIGKILLFSCCRSCCALMKDVLAELKAGGKPVNK